MKRALALLPLRLCLMGFSLFYCALSIHSYDYYSEGVQLFREGKMEEAIPLLYNASLQKEVDGKVFLYLGLSYQQTGKYADAISALMRGVSVQGTDKKALFFNAGNVYFLQKLFQQAEGMYSRALETDSSWAPAYLNRANSRVEMGSYEGAVEDYSTYLMLDPASWQEPSIRQLISLLSGEIKAKKDAEVRDEAARIAREAESAAQAERMRKLMDEVSSSLQSVDEASIFSAGSEDVLDYNEEGQLE